MDKSELLECFISASRRIVGNSEDRNYLKLSHEVEGGAKVREPEARHVICQVLAKDRIYHGIEVPTIGLYRFSGKGKRRALIDLTIFEGQRRLINIELKEGQPSKSDKKVNPIEKDVEKLLCEDVIGTAFFHILQASDRGTMPAIIKKYESAFKKFNEMPNRKEWILKHFKPNYVIPDRPTPFLLFILDLDVKNKRYYFCKKEDIRFIDKLDDGQTEGVKCPL